MKTVNQVSKIAGVSIRTLQYYDKIGLLPPSEYTEAGYRLYDDTDLERLQQILLFRELEFSLKDIKKIVDSPAFDKSKALEQQITLLTLKKEHIENLINLARGINVLGGNYMDFTVFDTSKIDEYAKEAKKTWGTTPEYKEFEKKEKTRRQGQQNILNAEIMTIFSNFGTIKDTNPSSEPAQALVKQLQNFITEHYYICSNEILSSLGEMYASGGNFTENIDQVGGEGTSEFANKAIGIFCSK